MEGAKFIGMQNDFAVYEIDESNKELADTKAYKAEKIKRRKTDEKKTKQK